MADLSNGLIGMTSRQLYLDEYKNWRYERDDSGNPEDISRNGA